MVSIGIRVYGSLQKVNDDHVPDVNCYYENQETLNNPPATGQENAFLQYIKQQMESQEHVRVNYAEISGNQLTVQWLNLGSPIAILTIITIIAVAIALFAVSAVLVQVYKIITFIGSEATNDIVSIVGFMLLLSFFSSIMNYIPKGVIRRKED